MSLETRSPPRAELGGLALVASNWKPEDDEFLDRNADLCKRSYVPPRERFVEADAVQGTREFPLAISDKAARWFFPATVRRSNIIRFAKIHVAERLRFDFDAWAEEAVNATAWLEGGWRYHDDWQAPRRWPDLTPESILLRGKHAPYTRREEVPPRLWRAVEQHIAAVRHIGYRWRSPEAIGRRLGLTAEFRKAHKLWWIGKPKRTRNKEQLAKHAQDEAARREAKGATPRDQSIAALARRLSIKPDTLQKKLRRMTEADRQALLAEHACPVFVEPVRERDRSLSGPTKKGQAARVAGKAGETGKPHETACPAAPRRVETVGDKPAFAVAARELADDRPRFAPPDIWRDLAFQLSGNPPPWALDHLIIEVGRRP